MLKSESDAVSIWDFLSQKIVEHHKSVQSIFVLPTKDDDSDLPSTYWIH